MTILPISLTAAAAAALVNVWLSTRVSRVRTANKVFMGDGGDESVVAAMRAHANFVEYTPFVLVLIALIELALGSQLWLSVVSAAYVLGRVAHGIGMSGGWPRGRMVGTIVTLVTLLGLAIVALTIPYLPIGVVTHSAMAAV